MRAWLRCPSRDQCTFIAHLTTTEPPGPIEYEQEPEDAWICSKCGGPGELVTGRDYETGALRLIDCPRCESSGVEPRYRAAS
jgi:ssDNA-binding Zn-finger/Zn-ribbon topoisomerase 1